MLFWKIHKFIDNEFEVWLGLKHGMLDTTTTTSTFFVTIFLAVKVAKQEDKAGMTPLTGNAMRRGTGCEFLWV